jgi:two-component system, cell cycle response regulator
VTEQKGMPALEELLGVADRLPTLPAVAIEILELTRDPDVSIEDLSYALARDPVLAAKLLRLANSSLFRRGDPVTTLTDAAVRLGLKTVKLMALSFSLADAIPAGASKGADPTGYWRSSLVTTVASRSFARLSKSAYEDEAFLCGLLSRIGELVLEECIPERWNAVLVRGAGMVPSPEVQREVLGFDHTEVGARLLQSWNLPDLIWQAVRWQASPQSIPAGTSAAVCELARTLHTASAVSDFICGAGESRHLARIEELASEFFGMASGEVDAFVVALESGIIETAMLLNARLPSMESYEALLERARRQLLAVSLETAVDLHQEKQRNEVLELENRELAGRLQRDPLTGLPNRGGFDEYLRKAVEERVALRVSTPLSLLMVDVDNFKAFNDTHGHVAGDEALRSTARAIQAGLRAGSLAGRYGGDEFGVVLPGCSFENLEAVAERIRLRVAEQKVEIDGKRIELSVTIGGACVHNVRSARDGRGLVGRADDCLYEAKHAGRNCTICREVDSV